MKKRILTVIAILLCAFTLFSTGIAPAMAYAPPSGEGTVSTQGEEVHIYYRDNNGVIEMRVWSLTYGYWMTDWIPVPDGWVVPNH